MTERPSPGEQLAGIAGLALFLIMFLFAWYSLPGAGTSGLNGLDAFDAFSDWLDLILILAAFSGMALGLFGTGVARSPIPLSIVTTVLAGVSAVLILICIVSTPSVPTFGSSAGLVEGSLGVEIGAWLGLIAAIALTFGGYRTMQEEGASFGGAADRLSGPDGGWEDQPQQPPDQQQHSQPPPAPQQPYQAPPPPPPPPAPEQPPAPSQYPPPPPPPPQQPPPPPPGA
jgi:hypothetical protein